MNAYKMQRKGYVFVCDSAGVIRHHWIFGIPSKNSLRVNLDRLFDLLHAYFIRDNMQEELKIQLYFRPYIKPLEIRFDNEPLDAIVLKDLDDLKIQLKNFGYAKSK